MIILALIYINNREIDKDTLFDQLKRMGLFPNENHEAIGDWEKLIENKFVKELYLEKKKTDAHARDGKVLYLYKIGSRSIIEIGKKNILYFIAKIYGDEVAPEELKELENEEESSESSSDEEEEEQGEEQSESQSQSQSQPQASQRAPQSPAQARGRGGRGGSSSSSQRGRR